MQSTISPVFNFTSFSVNISYYIECLHGIKYIAMYAQSL